MQRRSTWLVLSALATAACSSPMTSTPTTDVPTTDMVTVNDNGTPNDVQTPVDRPVGQDGGTMDVPTTGDGGTTDVPKSTDVPTTGDGGTTDVPRVTDGGDASVVATDPCAAGSVVDLNARGMLTGTVTRYAGNNRGISATPALTPSCGSINRAQVVHRYVPRATGRLRVSTNNTGTPMNFDTVVFAQTTCGTASDGGSTSLGCNDDVSLSTMVVSSAFTTTAAVTAGTPVFIVVAGYSTPATGRVGEADYVLTVDELTTVAVGGTCDTTGMTNGCAAGSSCVASTTTDAGSTGTCIADGASTGACRTAAGSTPCDTGLTCSGSRCVAAIPVGGSCATGVAGACAMGSSCVTGTAVDGGTAPRTCIADGAATGACRTAAGTMPCDTGLACSSGRCVVAIAVGGACGTGVTGACVTGSSCISGPGADGGTVRTCVADGARGGNCRFTAGSMPCDTGLGCNDDGLCAPSVAVGGACDTNLLANVCAAGSFCIAADGGTTGTCQVGPYTESAISAPAFVDACAMGTRVALVTGDGLDDNHATAALTIPFTFRFYGADQTRFWPSTNGYGVFGTTAPSDTTGGPLPIDDLNVVAPFLDDLVLNAPTDAGTSSGICSATVGTAPNRRFVVEWQDVTRYSHTSVHLTFELILNETTNTIDYLYSRLEPTGTAADAPYANGANADIGLAGNASSVPVIHVGTVSTTAGIRFTAR